MIEKEFKNLLGFENEDIHIQKDIFEIAESKYVGLTHIFKLSEDTLYPGDVRNDFPSLMYLPSFENLNYNAYLGGLGNRAVPGHSAIVLDGQIFNNFTTGNDTKNYFNSISVPDIHGVDDFGNPKESTTINWNKQAIIKLDYHIQGIYGDYNFNEVYTFRNGYFEFIVKTDNQNCVIASGSSKFKNNFVDNAEINLRNQENEQAISSLNSAESYVDKYKIDRSRLNIEIVNGKLALIYEGIDSSTNFKIISNETVADNEWHHIVVNIGRPGTTRTHGKKFNKDYIEFWIDGQLDCRNNEILTNNKIIFPTIDFLLGDIETFMTSELPDGWKTADIIISESGPDNKLGFKQTNFSLPGPGTLEFNRLITHEFTNTFKQKAYSGILNYWISGINTSINKYDVQERYRLWRGFEKQESDSFIANAIMVNPIVTTNKKKALKLYWNNVNENVGGIELDNNYQVDSYSISHKTFNSTSEIYNLDLSNKISFNALPDVRIVIKDNIWIYGPGKYPRFGNLNSMNTYSALQRHPSSLFQYSKVLMDILSKEPFYLKDDWQQGVIQNIMYGGIDLKPKDRILLVGQIDKSENGIYTYEGIGSPLKRVIDADSPAKINNALIRITDGYYKDTSWLLSNKLESFDDNQIWRELEYHPENDNLGIQPHLKSRWTSTNGEERFIDLESDLNINSYDIICFMNYPKTNEEIKNNFIGYTDFEINKKYKDFIKSLKTVVANGASLYVSSPRLATDLGIVKGFTAVPQLLQTSDAASTSLSPFELNEPAERYFDTHRNNKYNLATTLNGLTNRETYLLTDFVNFVPENIYDYDQYHAKYSYRQFGLQEGNEFIIPGTALREITENKDLPGYKENQSGTKDLMTVEPQNILAGTVITKLANNYYNGSTLVSNPYDDNATTIVVHNGQQLGGTPINGKIFVNCVEDGYTFSRQEYNKARIQVIPQNEINETTATRAWQYSTARLNRKSQRINVSALTLNGQTTPTNGGGGPLIQSPSNASNGIIRSETDRNNVDYQSDLYPTIEEEIYTTQEIPVLSMTYLGLLWLAE
jgi:hypothetical protein